MAGKNLLASLTPEELEMKLNELASREKRLNLRENEIERQTRELTRREEGAHALSDKDEITALVERLQEQEDLIHKKEDSEKVLKERLAKMERMLNDFQNLRDLDKKSEHNEQEAGDLTYSRERTESPLQRVNCSNPFLEDEKITNDEVNDISVADYFEKREKIEKRRNLPRIVNIQDVTRSSKNLKEENSLKNATSDATVTRYVPSNPFIKEAIKAIPIFDGRNLFKFLKAIRKARDQFPRTSEVELLSLSKFRLSDSTSTLIDDIPIYTINDFIQTLKQIFASHQSSNYYRGQLANLNRRNNEPMLSFIDRFAEIHAAIVDCMCLELNKDALSDAEAEILERDSIQEFLYALPPDIRVLMNMYNVRTLPQVYAEAIKVEKRVEIDKNKHRSANTFQRDYGPPRENRREINYERRDNNPFRNNRSANDRMREVNYERRDTNSFRNNNYQRPREHANDRTNERRDNRPSNNRPNNNEVRRNSYECKYCGKPGHTDEYCFKKQRESGNEKARAEAGRNSSKEPEVRQVNAFYPCTTSARRD